MIDFTKERMFPLSQAPRRMPRRRSGKRVHTATLYRWAAVGCRGVILETLQLGGTKCTSREALQRFFERLSNLQSPSHGDIASRENPRQYAQRSEAETERLLDQLGL